MPSLNGFNALPLWLRGPQMRSLAKALEAFYNTVLTATNHTGKQWRIAHAQGNALDLIARERHIERIPSEPEALYRKRIQGAFYTARLGGTKPGLERTLALWGLHAVVLERDEHGLELDRIVVGFGGMWDQELVAELLSRHGRACRRYQVGEYPLTAPLPLVSTTQGMVLGRITAK